MITKGAPKACSPAARRSRTRPRRPSTGCSPRGARRRRREPGRSTLDISTTTTSGPGPRRLPLLQRPGQARRPGVARPPRPARRHGEDRHRRQRPGRSAPLPRGRPRPGNGHDRRRPGGAGRRSPARALPETTVFARVTPEQKSRIILAERSLGRTSASSATASTTPSPCTTPTSASRSTRPPTSPRTPPTSSCSTRISGSSPTASSRAAGSSPTPSSTS